MNHKTRTNQISRPGVTLLFTISMIVLFLLMGTTFVVVANDYFKTAVRRSRLNTYKVDATSLLDEAFHGVFRGVSLNDTSSSLRTHSILEDQYGYGYSATAASASAGAVAGLKVISITDLTTVVEIRDGFTPFDFAADYADGIFGGCVLSVVTGEAQGYSGRIVSTYWDGASELLLVVPTDTNGIDLTSIDDDDRIIINGRDFVGSGAGNIDPAAVTFDDVTGLAMKLGDGILTPNRKGQPRTVLLNGITGVIEPYIPFNNSTNEPYDIADENNMFLSGIDAGGDIIPSFHRDRAYDVGRAEVGTTAAATRGFSFRPVYINGDDNSSAQDAGAGNESYFGRYDRGSGARDTSITVNNEEGLDVDTDGDGENDAIWIDIGLPLQTDSQGRQFKPMVAYRVIDMDGRVNLNAHGSYADSELGAAGTPRRGGSYGVAEVTLGDVFGDTDYSELLNLRSGDDGATDVAGNTGNPLRAAQTLYGYVDHGLNTGNPASFGLFASGADVFGKNVVGRNISFYGSESVQGFSSYSTLTGASQSVPYAADLALGGGIGDSLFQAFELEPLLRSDDIDASLLDSRLRGLGAIESNIDSITTESAEIAMPPFSIVELLWGATGNDLMIYRDLVAQGYLSEEMLMGGLYDLNQPTGNGVDDDGNGIVDDPAELLTTQQTAQEGNPTLDLDNAGDGAIGDNLARQRKANQLYILALLVTGTDQPAFATEFTSTADYRTAVAQWAVNVVDFTDADSIMTAFEFDIEPFNGTIVDGNPATDDAGTEEFIVFGAERPELLISETFASHDRRNRDLGADNGDNDDTGSGNDNDWDSSYIPESSVFIELYNPWTQLDAFNADRLNNELPITVNADDATQVPPAELYASQRRESPITGNEEGYYGVNLRRTVANESGGGQTPVWRIAVKRDESDTTFLRAIFLADPSTADPDATATIVGDQFYPGYRTPAPASTPVSPNVVEPGGYLVIGSSGNVSAGSEFRTTFGRPDDNLPNVAVTRSIQLDNGSNVNGVVLREGGGGTTPQACGVIVVDEPRSLSFSDPDGGYLAAVAAVLPPVILTPEDDGTLITPALDTPLDAGVHPDDVAAIWNNGVRDEFRHIYLQRLADPTRGFNIDHNPYITIDRAEVDLLSFNGLNLDADNDDTQETGGAHRVTSTNTAMVSSERGENRDTIGETRDPMMHTTPARRTFFRTADIEEAATFIDSDTGFDGSDNHNFSFRFTDVGGTGHPLISLGRRNEAIGGAAGSTEPLGDLVWLNRPFANSMELVHVPIFPNGGADAETMGTLLDRFNLCREIDDIPALTASSSPQDIFAYYMGDDKFGHLMGFGGMSPVDAGAGEMNGSSTAAPTRRDPTRANRFDLLFDFVDVPSKFQGLRTWLNASITSTPASAASNGMSFSMHAPYNSLPSFRNPGKININSMSEDDVYEAIAGRYSMAGGFTSNIADYDELSDVRDAHTTLTDFGGRFIPASRAQFVHENPRSNAQAGLFRRNPADVTQRIFDREAIAPGDADSNTNISSWYENEFRQRLGAVATTRSSVFSIWITIGYFEVDEYGRVGPELGADEGQVRRNRAFYMVDRSIPVACEPGKNHNVDKAVLVRTIIE
jgi:hypothetical protein